MAIEKCKKHGVENFHEMERFIAKRVRFRNGERHSVLGRPGGLPVHEATLYLAFQTNYL